MAGKTSQVLVRVLDTDIGSISAGTGKSKTQVPTEYIVLTHTTEAMDSVPTLNINGTVALSLGVIGSNSSYEYKRISPTQTIVVVKTFLDPIVDLGAWNATTSYALNDKVVANFRTYYSQIANNVGNDPAYSVAAWNQIPYQGVEPTVTSQGTWSNTTSYTVNDFVVYDRLIWYCTEAHSGQIPKAGSIYWDTTPFSPASPSISVGAPSVLPIGQASIGSTFVIQ